MANMNDTPTNYDQLGDSESIQIVVKFTIAAIVLIFMMVVFFFFVDHLYASRYGWRVENARVVSAGQAANLVAAMNRGLDPTVLESLPVVVFSSAEFKDGLELECSVCLSEFVDGEKTRLLPKCNHGFHVGCIDMWFQSHSTCPLCRNPVSSEPEAQAIGTTSAAATMVSESSSESSQLSPVVDEGGPSHMVIDIPMETVAEICSSEDRCSADEVKSPPVLTRMQTFKRLLSREKQSSGV